MPEHNLEPGFTRFNRGIELDLAIFVTGSGQVSAVDRMLQSHGLSRRVAPSRDTQRGAAEARDKRPALKPEAIAHVLYAFNNQGLEKTFLEGRYLNQELIDEEYAKPV